ncbi:uncharacterized protein LOC143248935 isoform X2 [Tachypleus tridentatus]
MKCLNNGLEVVTRTGLGIDFSVGINFGVRRGKSGHDVVILNSKENDTAFKLELVIEENTCSLKYFTCPDVFCQEVYSSLSKLWQHHSINHIFLNKNDVVESIFYCCCDELFPSFQNYAKHVYNNHMNTSSVKFNFERIKPETGYTNSVKWFPGVRKNSFKDLLELAFVIIKNFGNYWLFYKNCQDFAAWYLHSAGIPLEWILPTNTDNITGSGTSGVSVQRFKMLTLYNNKKHETSGLKDIKNEYTASCAKCILPPMSLEDLAQHIKIAHSQQNEEKCQQNEELQEEINNESKKQIFHESSTRVAVMHGILQNLNLDHCQKRKYTVYKWENPAFQSSFVFQPWWVSSDKTLQGLVNSERPYDYYHSVELNTSDKNAGEPFLSIVCKPVMDTAHLTLQGHVSAISIENLEELLDCLSNEFSRYDSMGNNHSFFLTRLMFELKRFGYKSKGGRLFTVPHLFQNLHMTSLLRTLHTAGNFHILLAVFIAIYGYNMWLLLYFLIYTLYKIIEMLEFFKKLLSMIFQTPNVTINYKELYTQLLITLILFSFFIIQAFETYASPESLSFLYTLQYACMFCQYYGSQFNEVRMQIMKGTDSTDLRDTRISGIKSLLQQKLSGTITDWLFILALCVPTCRFILLFQLIYILWQLVTQKCFHITLFPTYVKLFLLSGYSHLIYFILFPIYALSIIAFSLTDNLPNFPTSMNYQVYLLLIYVNIEFLSEYNKFNSLWVDTVNESNRIEKDEYPKEMVFNNIFYEIDSYTAWLHHFLWATAVLAYLLPAASGILVFTSGLDRNVILNLVMFGVYWFCVCFECTIALDVFVCSLQSKLSYTFLDFALSKLP